MTNNQMHYALSGWNLFKKLFSMFVLRWVFRWLPSTVVAVVVGTVVVAAIRAKAETKMATVRILGYSGGILRLGVSTDRFQFGMATSTNRVDWKEQSRTWILSGTTNEISLPIPMTTVGMTTFIKVTP